MVILYGKLDAINKQWANKFSHHIQTTGGQFACMWSSTRKGGEKRGEDMRGGEYRQGTNEKTQQEKKRKIKERGPINTSHKGDVVRVGIRY